MAARINVVRAKLAKIQAEIATAKVAMNALLGVPAASLTPSQQGALDAHERTIVTLTKEQADLAAENVELERKAAAEEAAALQQYTDGHPGAAQTAGGGRGRRFADMFGPVASLDGWRNVSEFLAVLHNGLSDERLLAATPGTGTIPMDGGFAVPSELARQWLDSSLQDEIVRPRAAVWGMTSDTRSVPGIDASSASSSLFGGFTANWVGQGDEIAPELPKLRLLKLVAVKLGILSEVSNELLSDGVGYEEQLSTSIQAAIGWFLDSAFLTGTGAGQPLGALNASCTIQVAAEGGQSAATIVYPNLVKMFARLHPRSLGNSVWVANSTTIPQLTTLTIPVGTGGAHVPVLREADGGFTILTRPVIFTEKVPALGARGDISLCDFSQYAVGLRKEIALDKSGHIGFTRDTTHYRGTIRADGQPMWGKAYTPKYGDSLSPFVVLAARP